MKRPRWGVPDRAFYLNGPGLPKADPVLVIPSALIRTGRAEERESGKSDVSPAIRHPRTIIRSDSTSTTSGERFMKLRSISLAGILAMSLTACGTVPQSRSHFIELMKEQTGSGSFQRMAFSKTVARPFDPVVANIDDKLQRCVPGGH